MAGGDRRPRFPVGLLKERSAVDDYDAFIGLDVHKDSISVAVARAGRDGEIKMLGVIENSPDAVAKLVRNLVRRHGRIEVTYEAGPCGYAIFRQMAELGVRCRVVAPSHTPRRPGERVKNDTRDAMMLARLLRSGELTFIWVPDTTHEAMRDLVRARQVASQDVRAARALIQLFMLRNDLRYVGKSWSQKHRAWLSTRSFEHSAQKLALQSYLHRLEQAEARKTELEAHMEELIPAWSLAPIVHALQVFKGIGMVTAATLAAEIGDFSRFPDARKLMAYLGLVPSEHSSGRKIRPGGITKAGNTISRVMLVEAAWSYRWPPKVGELLLRKRDGYDQALKDAAWKAQLRLHKRFRRLEGQGKRSTVAATAVARELAGFIWATAISVGPRAV